MKEIFSFLSDLAAHNNKEWMDENRDRYESCREEFKGIVTNLIAGIGSFDESVVGLAPKDCIFRINRDIRFSKNKDPYKTNFGAAITPGGKRTANPTYYLHVEPGKSMMACGVYHPDAENLKKIRQEIDYNAGELKKIVENPAFAETFGPIRGDALKTAPKGYPKDHPNLELLKFKDFIAWKSIDDKFFFKDGFEEALISRFKVSYPFNQYLAVAIS